MEKCSELEKKYSIKLKKKKNTFKPCIYAVLSVFFVFL